MNLGVQMADTNVSCLPFADAIVILAGEENNLHLSLDFLSHGVSNVSLS